VRLRRGRAIGTGDLRSLLDILAPNVVLLGDGGGVVQAVPDPVAGARRVAEPAAELGRSGEAATLRSARVNGHPALILRLHGEIDTVVSVRVDDGLVTGLYAVRNPMKLSRVERATTLCR
jgi:RNA polymerase sigma-70 factor (ECF subfamily)